MESEAGHSKKDRKLPCCVGSPGSTTTIGSSLGKGRLLLTNFGARNTIQRTCTQWIPFSRLQLTPILVSGCTASRALCLSLHVARLEGKIETLDCHVGLNQQTRGVSSISISLAEPDYCFVLSYAMLHPVTMRRKELFDLLNQES